MQDEKDAPPRRASAAHLKAPAAKAPPAPLPPAPASPPARRSVANLVVRRGKSPARPARVETHCEPPRHGRETVALVGRLRSLLNSLPPNKNERAVTMIKACIIGGVCKGPQIISFLVHLGFNNSHAGQTLYNHTLGKKWEPHWSKGDDGRYRLLD